MTRFLLVDTFNMLKRAQMVTRGDAYEKAGLALAITINSINWAWKKFEADHVVFCLEGRSWRKDEYSLYKANRAVKLMGQTQIDIDEDQIFIQAANDFMEFIQNHTNCTLLKHSRCEADDFIARWIQIFGKDPAHKFTIVSADTDFVQLLAPNVEIYDGVQKKLYRADGIYDEKMKPFRDKKGNVLPAINPEYELFEKIVRGDSSDNVPSCFPGVRTKGSAKKVGIEEAFADRHNQGYTWFSFMKSRWEDPDGNEHIVEDDFKRNTKLIDLTCQPDEIKNILDNSIIESVSEQKNVQAIGIQFLKFCGRHELKRLAENADGIIKIFGAGFDRSKI